MRMAISVPVAVPTRFVYDETVNVDHADVAVSRIAAAIGEPARARMLYCLADGRARTSTELGVVGRREPLDRERPPQSPQDRAAGHRLRAGQTPLLQPERRRASPRALEALSVVAGGRATPFVPNTPNRLRAARTCYDHMAGTIGGRSCTIASPRSKLADGRSGERARLRADARPAAAAFEALGIDVEATRAQRRRFAFACVDWSERRPHIGGALGAALLGAALKRRWVVPGSRQPRVDASPRRDGAKC